jgi:amino acid adenylation domain-containing protein
VTQVTDARVFPLTDIQAAYVVGKSQLIELGGRQQYYVELDSVGFDPARAELSLNRLVRRHEQLRTVMSEDGTQRVMDMDETPPVRVSVVDLTGLHRDRQEEAIGQIRERLCDQGLDPTGWPLFGVVVSRVRRHRVRVHLRCSLLLLDAPSIRIVITDWEKLYVDPDAQLPPVRQTFRDWRMSLLDYEQTDEFRQQLGYWERRLESLPEAPALPLVRQPRSISVVRFQGRTSYLSKQQWQQFCANFRKHRVLPTTALLHVYAEALGAWAASGHFCLNVVHLNLVTRHPGEDVVGQRTATLPLEVDLRHDGSFWARAQRLQRQLWRDMANSDVTGVRISRELAARYGWSQRAALPYVFTSNQGPGWDTLPAEGGPIFRFLGRIQHTPQVLIDDQIRDTRDGGIASNLDFVDEAFPPGLPDLIAGAYQRLLLELSTPDGANREPDLMSRSHRAVIAAVNDTAEPVPAARLEDGFLRQAGTRPDAVAVRTSGLALTYSDVEARSRAVALWLHERGADRDDVVPVVMSKGWEQVVAVLGVLRAGVAYCPVDTALPATRIAELVAECRARVVLGQSHSTATIDTPEPVQMLAVDRVEPVTGGPPAIAGEPTDLAYVIYTSGSTGRPKGVMIEHQGAVNTIMDVNERLGLGPADRVLGISSLSFDLSVWDVFGTLAAGGTLVLPDATARPDPIGWAATAARHGVTVWNSVPALAEMLLEVAEQRPELDRPPVRAFLLSGDWIPVALPDRLRGVWDGARVIAMGGATEASIWSNIFEVGRVDPGWRSIPYGTPLKNQTMVVLDERMGVRQPWTTGAIHIGGTGLARGYWRDPDRTAERFVRHPVTRERLYRTGDLGRYWPDGTIEFLGREDRQVKIQGFRVEPGEVEAALREHPAVAECVVCVDDAPGGQRRLVALAVPESGTPPAVADLTAHLGSRLPHYLVPGHIQLVAQLPLTPNGKVDAARASQLLAASRLEATGAEDGPLIGHIGGLWAELLELPAIDPDSNFFALGGNSLLALRMVNRIRTELGVELTMGEVFEAPTVRTFTARVAGGERRATCLVQLSEGTGEELFLFHVLGGSIARYRPLAQSWPGPAYAFQSRSQVEGTEAAFALDFEGMAASYREELLRHRPEGPYILGGWSMGGSLAYEVGRQLAALGHQTYVFMIDSEIRDVELPLTEVARHVSFLTVLALAPPPPAAVAAVQAAPPGTVAPAAREAAIAHGLLPADIDLTGYERLMRVMEHELAALGGYRPGRRDQPALLFLATEETDRPDSVPAWRALCPALDIEPVACNHYTISDSERFAAIAGRVAAWVAGKRSPALAMTTTGGDR